MPTVNELPLLVGTTSGAFIPGSNNRIGLIISAGLANRFTMSLRGVAVLDQGITIYPGTLPLRLNYEDDGEWVKHPMVAISAVAAQTVNVLEIFP